MLFSQWTGSACAGEDRSSLFSDSGNRLPLFNPFAAAMATLGPAERYESEFMGASEFLNRRLNEEFQRAFEAAIPSSALYIYISPEISRIGTPSDRTTSEGVRSALSHGTSSLSVQGSGSGIPRKVVSTRKTSGLKRVVGRPPVPSFSCAFNPF